MQSNVNIKFLLENLVVQWADGGAGATAAVGLVESSLATGLAPRETCLRRKIHRREAESAEGLRQISHPEQGASQLLRASQLLPSNQG